MPRLTLYLLGPPRLELNGEEMHVGGRGRERARHTGPDDSGRFRGQLGYDAYLIGRLS